MKNLALTLATGALILIPETRGNDTDRRVFVGDLDTVQLTETNAVAKTEDSFQEMLDTPFQYWENASFTAPECNYCCHRDCVC